MTEAAKKRLRKGWPLALVLGVLMAAGLGSILLEPSTAQQPQPPSGPPLVPVSIARVTQQDVPIYLKGLGSVQAFNSVLVRARVDGTLTEFPVTEGQEVKQGDLIAVIDPRPYQAALDAAMAKKSQDDADFVNSKSDLARYTSLEQKSFASHQQVDTQQALVNHMIAAIAGDNAAIEMAKLNLSYCFITSPIQGRVGLRQVDPGNLVHGSDAAGIVTITQIHPISALFTVPQDSLPSISVAMEKGKLPVIAFAADDKTQLDQGALLTPDNAIDSSTGTIKLKATFPNPHNTLWPGQFINARLQLGTQQNALTVPSVAVQHGPVGLYVYVVGPDQSVARQPVEVGSDDGALSVIAKGLSEGQQVVTEGQSRLQVGTKVAVNDASQQAAAPAKPGG
ncbi:MAG TPA: efflux RND transporter periplasmic adaptor subunit [Acetobacteraceae bacterium]|nr:efflux RND transporter periplasmic adaptor subunit [Acetobacteraceae bacterium]